MFFHSLLRAVALVCFALVGGCASTDPRLIGSWKSNKKLTVASLRYPKPIAAAKRARFESLFGKMVVTYDRTHVTLETPPTPGQPAWRDRSRYRVVASDQNSVALVSTNPLTGEREISHVHFDSPDRYWLYLYGTGWKEYFDRIAPR